MNVIARKPTNARHNVVSRYSNEEGLGTDNSGSGKFNWLELINTGIGATESVLLGILGKGDKYQAQALATINEEQKKTTYILWAIIAIVLVLAAFVIIKKK